MSTWKKILFAQISYARRDIFLLLYLYILTMEILYRTMSTSKQRKRKCICVRGIELTSFYEFDIRLYSLSQKHICRLGLGWPRQFLLKCLYQAWGSVWSCICELIVSIFLFLRFFYWILGCSDSGIFPPIKIDILLFVAHIN